MPCSFVYCPFYNWIVGIIIIEMRPWDTCWIFPSFSTFIPSLCFFLAFLCSAFTEDFLQRRALRQLTIFNKWSVLSEKCTSKTVAGLPGYSLRFSFYLDRAHIIVVAISRFSELLHNSDCAKRDDCFYFHSSDGNCEQRVSSVGWNQLRQLTIVIFCISLLLVCCEQTCVGL